MPAQVSGNLIWSWWIKPTAVKVGGDILFTGISSDGNWRILENNSNNYFTLGNGQNDDHNAPCVVASEGKATLCFYTEHGLTTYVRYRKAPAGTFNFGSEQQVEFGQSTTYAQTLVIGDTIVLLTRSPSGKWKYAISTDYGETWSEPFTLMDATSTGKIYCLTSPTEDPNIYHFVSYGHPSESTWRNVVHAKIDMLTGDVTSSNGSVLANLYTGAGLPMVPSTPDLVWTPEESGEKVRLLDVGDRRGQTIIYYGKWTDEDTTADYYQAVQDFDGNWEHTHIVSSGGNFEGTTLRNYLGGISIDKSGRDIVYISRLDGTDWKIEEWNIDLRLEAHSPKLLDSSLYPLVRPVAVVGDDSVLYQKLTKYNSFTDWTSLIYKA